MNMQARNVAAMKAGQSRWDNMTPDDGPADGYCPDCDFTCSAREAIVNEYEGRCPECGGILEADE